MPTTRFVSRTRGVDASAYRGSGLPLFSDRARPARTIAEGLASAVDHDTVEIIDAARYPEGELLIQRPVTLTSSAYWDRMIDRPNSYAFDPRRYPTVTPGARGGRVIRVDGSQRRVLPVEISGLVVSGGRTTSGRTSRSGGEPALGAGAGIAIVNVASGAMERTRPTGMVVRGCAFYDNQTTARSAGVVPMAQLENRLERQLPALQRALRSLPGGSMLAEAFAPLERAGRSVPRRAAAIPNTNVGPQAFGGGLCFLWSSGRVEGCRFERNQAMGRGGGAAVAGYGWPVFADCVFHGNTARAETRRDGGAIGFENAIPDRLGQDLTVADLINDVIRWLDRLSPIDLAAILIRALVTGALHREELNRARARGPSGLKQALAYFAFRAYLSRRRWEIWSESGVRAARTSYSVVSRCTFTANRAVDDGGAVYASVLSRVHIEESSFTGNLAMGGSGGAIRATMGSDVTVVASTIERNTSSGGLAGGGGIAVRNAQLHVRGQPSGQRHGTKVARNRASGFAGGGYSIAADTEGGGLGAGLSDFYHAILAVVFEFPGLTVRVDNQTFTRRNEATSRAHGKGGGFYLFRNGHFDVTGLDVQIADFVANVTGNRGHAGLVGPAPGAASRPPSTTDLINLQDQVAGLDIADAQVPARLRGGAFVYRA